MLSRGGRSGTEKSFKTAWLLVYLFNWGGGGVNMNLSEILVIVIVIVIFLGLFCPRGKGAMRLILHCM